MKPINIHSKIVTGDIYHLIVKRTNLNDQQPHYYPSNLRLSLERKVADKKENNFWQLCLLCAVITKALPTI